MAMYLKEGTKFNKWAEIEEINGGRSKLTGTAGTNLSREMMHKLRMEAVHSRMSNVAQIRHNASPSGQLWLCNRSSSANGIISRPTSKSAVANDVSRKFVNVRIRLYMKTDNTTSTLPNTVARIRTICGQKKGMWDVEEED